MKPAEYLAKMELLGDEQAYSDGRLPAWVANLVQNLNKSVFREIADTGIQDMEQAYSKGFYAGLGKLFDQLMQKTELPDQRDHEDIDDLPLIQELSNLYTDSVKQENNSDEALCEYFFGVKKGKESVLDEQGRLKHSTLSSELSLIMFAAWPYIDESISNRRQMYDFFVNRLGKQRVGDFKRVEKFLQRIGFSPAEPGRPPTSTCA